jgi:TPR repeat protein
MRAIFYLAAIFATDSAVAQMRQFGDVYSGNQQTIRMHVDQNQLSSIRPFVPPVYRPPDKVWIPSVPSYWSPRNSANNDSRSQRSDGVAYQPPAYLVPFGKPGSGRAQSPDIRQDMLALYLTPGSGGDPGRAVAIAQARAAAGDTEAMVLLALASYQGKGLPADQRKSFEWMSKAAAANDVGAQTFLGEMYLYGVGVARDDAKALAWLQKAADAGEPLAALRYARALVETGRAAADYSVPLRYAQKAEAVVAEASVEVGLILTLGKSGVPADAPRGVAAFERAARAGNAMGQYLYAVCLQTGTGVAKDQAAAIPWLQKASDQGLAIAQLQLGRAYYFAQGTAHDYRRALALLEQAAAQDETRAFDTLGRYYSDGLAVAANNPRAIGYFRKAAERGDPEGQTYLALAYLVRNGGPADDREAARLLNLSADAGQSMAQYFAGINSLRGLGVSTDVALGIRRLQQSAAGGFVFALNQLCDETTRTHGAIRMDSPEFTPTLTAGVGHNQPACLYIQAARLMKGILGPEDQVKALDLLKRAAEGGYYNAELDYGRSFLALVGQVDASYNKDLLANARDWITRSAEHGSAAATKLLDERGWR